MLRASSVSCWPDAGAVAMIAVIPTTTTAVLLHEFIAILRASQNHKEILALRVWDPSKRSHMWSFDCAVGLLRCEMSADGACRAMDAHCDQRELERRDPIGLAIRRLNCYGGRNEEIAYRNIHRRIGVRLRNVRLGCGAKSEHARSNGPGAGGSKATTIRRNVVDQFVRPIVAIVDLQSNECKGTSTHRRDGPRDALRKSDRC